MASRLGLVSVAALAIAVSADSALAGVARQVELSDRLRGAEKAVVARVETVEARFERNRFGDELIISHVRLVVEEGLKGERDRELWIDVEGGTVGDLTLEVSDLPALAVGDRGVFLMERTPEGAFVPHLRGQGILKLDRDDQVVGTGLALAQIRNVARQVGR